MEVKLRMTGKQHADIKSHVMALDGKEAGSLLLCEPVFRNQSVILLVNEVIHIPYEACRVRTPVSLSWPTEELLMPLYERLEEELTLIMLHSHPTGFDNFSDTDNENDFKILPRLNACIEGKQPHGSAIMLPDGSVKARLMDANDDFVLVDMVSVVGDDIRFFGDFANDEKGLGYVKKTDQVYGSATTSIMRRLKIGVVGCSGTGSPMTELLLRYHTSHLVLIDFDNIEEGNLNRMLMSRVTATKKDDLLRKLKYGVCAFALAGMVMMAAPAASFSEEAKAMEQAEVQVEKQAQEQTAEKRQKIVSEALSALQETNNALKALDEGRNEDALASLEKATGKLEIVLAREPRLAFAPVSAVHSTQDIITNVESAKRMVKEAEDLLEDGYVQDARLLLDTMASETVITVTGLPMGTYPAAIKQAAAFIDEGQTEAAKTVLQTALNTLAIDVTVIPIPVASAERLLRQAETLSEKKERTDEENKRLTEFLNAAETEIKFAQVLGYGKKKDFEDFYKEIETIREKTAEGKSGSGFFKKIKGFMTSMTDDSQPEESVNN